MDIGEMVSVAPGKLKKGKCVICGKDHSDPKREKIKETAPGNKGWHRQTMTGVFESDGIRNTVYPANTFPPTYEYQGQHCFALSSLVADANSNSPKDRRIILNYYLDKIGFYPNRPRNCIGLPARKSYGDFDAFWEALDANKPLQMHGPGHDESYFVQCENMLNDMIQFLVLTCDGLADDQWEADLQALIEFAENCAFKHLAHNDFVWRLHRSEQDTAMDLYWLPKTKTLVVRGPSNTQVKRRGLGRPKKPVKYPSLSLATGPFEGT